MMKKLNILFYAFVLIGINGIISAQAQADDTAVEEVMDGPIMEFKSLTVDYGTIEQNSEPLRVAEFTNTGTKPLVIKNARGSCGCTVPDWPKEPIMPGQTAEIQIRYDTNRLGKINKTVTITTNEEGAPKVLKVVGTINQAIEKEESVPAPSNGLIKKNN
ncbi:MAG: DUF1573 domain-containing protein [Bacteroidota bacterium]